MRTSECHPPHLTLPIKLSNPTVAMVMVAPTRHVAAAGHVACALIHSYDTWLLLLLLMSSRRAENAKVRLDSLLSESDLYEKRYSHSHPPRFSLAPRGSSSRSEQGQAAAAGAAPAAPAAATTSVVAVGAAGGE